MEPTWWQRTKHEWLYKKEIARQQRLARKYARLQAKEQRRTESSLASGPSISERYREWKRRRLLKKEQSLAAQEMLEAPPVGLSRVQEWKRQRQLKREQRALAWQEMLEENPRLAWFKKHETKFFWLLTVVLVGAFSGYVTLEAKRVRDQAEHQAKFPMATINGVPIYRDTVMDRALFAHGAALLQELSEQEIVRQEAEKQNIELTGDDMVMINRVLKVSPQPRVQKHRLVMSFRLRKLILKDVTEERKQEVYRDFKDDVKTYVLSSISFSGREKADAFLAALKDGTSVKAAALDYSLDAVPPAPLGDFTSARLDRVLGRIAAKSIKGLEPGEFSAPLALKGQQIIYRLDEVQTEYEDVKQAVETLIVEAEAPQYMYRILAEAKIESPFIDPATSDFKEDTPGPLDTPSPTPTPSSMPVE